LLSSYLIDDFLNHTIRLPEEQSSNPAEKNKLAFNLYLPYNSGSVLSNKVEPILLEKKTFNEKMGLTCFFAILRNSKLMAQYTHLLIDSKQVKSTTVYFYQLQI
jgi:hypothetical protein